ncbi:MAG: UbiA family prenyltransferase [Pirellulales bacterium]|nr:UbiA family prenyltransferase [Pirellulales bacterium]
MTSGGANDSASAAAQHRRSIRAWLELVRLPNVFTALADILLGFYFTHELHATEELWPALALLLISSAAIYTAGMALNDYFDRAVDARLRSGRPIPSGRVSAPAAARLGWSLLAIGFVAAAGAGMYAARADVGSPSNVLETTALLDQPAVAPVVAGQSIAMDSQVPAWRPGLFAVLLIASVVGYDALLKRTLLGPLAMGACRFFNVLLGMSLAAGALHPVPYVVAGGIGVYIVGVTWFARREAIVGRQLELAMAVLVMFGGLALLAWFPSLADDRLSEVSQPTYTTPERWWLLMGLLGSVIAWRVVGAVVDPRPELVQFAVRQCIISLVILDASACFVVRGMPAAAIILALLAPLMILQQWFYST